LASQVSFHRLAAQEAWAAEAWYSARSVEVAERFRQAVLVAARRIADNDATHPISGTRFHYVHVSRFPYRLIFCFESEQIAKIIAVAHYRRRPNYWRRRD
jgi:toxin ParE1/3/4